MDKELLYVLAGLGALILLSRKAKPTPPPVEAKPAQPPTPVTPPPVTPPPWWMPWRPFPPPGVYIPYRGSLGVYRLPTVRR